MLAPAATATPAQAAPAVSAPVIAGINLQNATIPQLQLAMNEGKLTSVQLTEFYLQRIDLLNPVMHAVIGTNPDALQEAAASDARRHRNALRGPMDGIPVLLKDNIGTADLEGTAAGSYALIHARPAQDAGLVTRLRAAGAVILGKANMSEWAGFRSTNSSTGWSAIGGQGENPYEYGRSPCGSSSGPAAAVAAALTQVAVGTETDGSIVCPSSMNGDVGIKTSLGLVSTSGVVPLSKEQDVPGPIARNVTDAAILLSVIAGPDPRDPATLATARYARALQDYTRLLNPHAMKGLRIGVWRTIPGPPAVAPATMAVFNHAVKELRRFGATTVNITIPDLSTVLANEPLAIPTEFHHDINAYLATLPGLHPRSLAGLIRFDNEHAAVEMKYFTQNIFTISEATNPNLKLEKYIKERAAATGAAQRGINQTLSRYHLDAIVCPTANPAWKIPLGTGAGDFGLLSASSTPAAVAGYPSVSVPMGFVGPLPVGMSIMAGDFSEPTLISIAYAWQQDIGARRPPKFLRFPG
jgi:amidase